MHSGFGNLFIGLERGAFFGYRECSAIARAIRKKRPSNAQPASIVPSRNPSILNARCTGVRAGTHCMPFHHHPPDRGTVAGIHWLPVHWKRPSGLY